MMPTGRVVKVLKITRTTLNYQCLRHGIRPRQRIVNGRTYNSYSVRDVERLRDILRNNFKETP